VENWVSVLFGCAVAVGLALATDQLLAMVEAGVARRRPALAWIGAALLMAGVGAAMIPAVAGQQPGYVVGAKSFSEQYILGELMADRIRRQGASATVRAGLGSVVAFRALTANEIDVYVDYSGTIWANVMQRKDAPSREAMLEDMAQWLRREYGVALLGALGFENAYALAMRRERAQALGVRSIADLAGRAPRLSIGGDFEFFARPEWRALRDRYELQFREQRQFQSTFMYQAVEGGDVDVISAFSSDGRVAAYDLVVLEDPKQVILPYDAIVLVSPARAADSTLRRSLEALVGAIPIERMRQASLMVDRYTDKASPQKAAEWLAEAQHFD
jgi:osmoprotectant transport system permease protein